MLRFLFLVPRCLGFCWFRVAWSCADLGFCVVSHLLMNSLLFAQFVLGSVLTHGSAGSVRCAPQYQMVLSATVGGDSGLRRHSRGIRTIGSRRRTTTNGRRPPFSLKTKTRQITKWPTVRHLPHLSDLGFGFARGIVRTICDRLALHIAFSWVSGIRHRHRHRHKRRH